MTRTDWNPEMLLELSGGYWKICALHAAVELDVFTVIGKDHLSAEAVAEKIHADARGTAMLLNAMTAMHLLEKSGNLYTGVPGAVRFLSRTSSDYIGYMIKHHHHLVPSWGKLDEAVRTGKSVRTRATHGTEEERESFLMGMYNNAMTLAARLIPAVDLSGRKSLLDLGGGPGTYAIQFCLKYPELKAVVFDLPTTRPFAEKTIAAHGLTDRIAFQAGSYLTDPVDGRYDVVWLSHNLHGEGLEDCQNIVRKAVAALVPGGMILIHEFILDNDMSGPLFPALFSLNMLVGTSSGQAYSQQQLIDMLARCGVKNIRRIFFESPNDSGIVAGIV
jgi:SAM-dependent methyltransferase